MSAECLLDQTWKEIGREPIVMQLRALSIAQEDLDVAHEILPGLFLGDKFGATTHALLAQHGIKALLMLCARDERDEKWWSKRRLDIKYEEGWRDCGIEVVRISAEDKLWYPLIPVDLPGTIEFLDKFWSALSMPVYVHCQAGASRSATLLTAYLMFKHPRLTAQDALTFVRGKRPKIDPNKSYCNQLEEWSRRIPKSSSPPEALAAWNVEPTVHRILQAKARLDALLERHVQALRVPGQEDWSRLKDIDALKHDIMNCAFPVQKLEDLEDMLKTQSEDFPDEFPFLDVGTQAAIRQIMSAGLPS